MQEYRNIAVLYMPHKISLKEFMVHLQTFTTNDYLLKKIALIIISYKIKRKYWKNLFNSLEISKTVTLIIRTCSNWSE